MIVLATISISSFLVSYFNTNGKFKSLVNLFKTASYPSGNFDNIFPYFLAAFTNNSSNSSNDIGFPFLGSLTLSIKCLVKLTSIP
jgi:hypothetical protein